jgi:hypothetical protein
MAEEWLRTRSINMRVYYYYEIMAGANNQTIGTRPVGCWETFLTGFVWWERRPPTPSHPNTHACLVMREIRSGVCGAMIARSRTRTHALEGERKEREREREKKFKQLEATRRTRIEIAT